MDKKLAIEGGNPAITIPKPHWRWLPASNSRHAAVAAYMTDESDYADGYPKMVRAFEEKFTKYVGRPYALTLNSGTSALHAAYIAVSVTRGDEVIVPTLTLYATVTPLIDMGVTSIFCDASPDTGNIAPEDIRNRITTRTKAIAVTHLCGHPCDMDAIMAITEENGIMVIEDCSHAHGATIDGKLVGAAADIAIFSMDNKKILAVVEVGVLITDKQILWKRALLASDFDGRLDSELKLESTRRYFETGLKFKHRIYPLAAAIAFSELDKLEEYCQLRQSKLRRLSEAISGLPGIRPPP